MSLPQRVRELEAARDRLAMLAQNARSIAAAPDYDEHAVAEALWNSPPVCNKDSRPNPCKGAAS